MSSAAAAQTGAAALVPPTVCQPEPSHTVQYTASPVAGLTSPSSAFADTSGTWRQYLPELALQGFAELYELMTPEPCCQPGIVQYELMPPPLPVPISPCKLS